MRRSFLAAAVLALGALAQAPALRAEPDLYSFPDVEDVKVRKEDKPADPFALAAAKRFGLKADVLSRAVEKGFGRTELLRLAIMAQRSGKSLEDLIAEREKGTRLAKIAQSAGLDNRKVRREAMSLLPELESAAREIQADLKRSSATAGVAGGNGKEGE